MSESQPQNAQRRASTSRPNRRPESTSPADGLIDCTACLRSFGSKRGLSLHQRKAHFDMYMTQTTAPPMKKRRVSEGTASALSAMHLLKELSLENELPLPPEVSGVKTLLLAKLNEEKYRTVRPFLSRASKIGSAIKGVMQGLKRKCVCTNFRPRVLLSSKIATKKLLSKLAAKTSLKELASEVLDNRSSLFCDVPRKTVLQSYQAIWEKEDSYRSLGQFVDVPVADNSRFVQPITVEEVHLAMSKLRADSAPGPDGLKKSDILGWDPTGVVLARVFNTMYAYGVVPAQFKQSRTVLLPKSYDQQALKDIRNWRPITIGPIILRLFSNIVNRRLTEACPAHPRQKGFTETPGCAENLQVLKGLIDMSKVSKRSLAVVFVDFAKAFDSISHQHIDAALACKKVDIHIRRLIKSAYRQCTTNVMTGSGFTPPIKLKVGVKQGDPLSPTLFNLALDPLIHMLERKGRGFAFSDCILLTAMAYADDLVLVSDSWEGMALNIGILEVFSSLTGLGINPTKCHGFFLDKGSPDPHVAAWKILNQAIDMVGPLDTVSYLGVKINPWRGFIKPPIRDEVRSMLSKISDSGLRPSVKLSILREFAMPRLLYLADNSMIKKTVLDWCDRDIRASVRKWLHLNPTSANGLLYSSFADGGLNIMRLGVAVPAAQARRLVRLLASEDAVTEAVAAFSVNQVWLKQLLHSLVNGEQQVIPSRLADFDLSHISGKKLRAKEFGRWEEFPFHGKGVSLFRNDKVSNNWLRCPVERGFSQSDFILALKLRSNSVPVRASVASGITNESDKMCRLCGTAPETLAHILGVCKVLTKNRLVRHNRICKLLVGLCRSYGWEVRTEPKLYDINGTLRIPDIVIRRGHDVIIIDVAVPLETSHSSLTEVACMKANKYKPFCEAAKGLFPGASSVSVWGFPVGAKGKWHRDNDAVLDAIGIPKCKRKVVARSCSNLALWGTIRLCKLCKKSR